MAFYERPNLKRKMEAAKARENAIRAKGPAHTKAEKEALRTATQERRAAETVYYSQSGQGHAPWQNTLALWGLLAMIIAMVVLVVVRLS